MFPSDRAETEHQYGLLYVNTEYIPLLWRFLILCLVEEFVMYSHLSKCVLTCYCCLKGSPYESYVFFVKQEPLLSWLMPCFSLSFKEICG